MTQHKRRVAFAATVAGISLLAAGCASGTTESPRESDASSNSVDAAEGRIAVGYEGGVAVLDPETLEVVGEFASEDFVRLNAFGDGRTVAVTTSEGFQILDTAEPALTDLVFDATAAGHVVIHGGKTVLFDDGTGTTTIVDTDAFADGYGSLPEATAYTSDAPHHGVSIVLEDGLLLTTVGDENGRTVIVGDYKNDPDDESYLLNAVALIDTAAHSYEVIDLPDEVQYTWRDVARGPGDRAYILSTDGQIHVLDPETGEITDAYPVIEAWEGPAEWQNPHPAIKVDGTIAYVTEPAKNSIHAIDLTTGEVLSSVELDHTPNEIAIS
ncbi:hypothetical protein [Microbacterium schleiferi]|nr:hypothetical protein [Microbacterium schleiferi]